MTDLSRLAQEKNTLEYKQTQEAKKKPPELIRIGEYDPNTGRDRVVFPNGGEAIAGVRTFNSSIPYGTPVRASQAHGSQVIAIDSRRYQPYDEPEVTVKTTGFILFLCLDETGSIGLAGVQKGIEIIDAFRKQVGKKKILGVGFVSFGDVICQVFDIDSIEKARDALTQAATVGGLPFFCDDGWDTPENGVDALSIAVDQIKSSKLAKQAAKKYIFLKTDTEGFAHNSNSPEELNLALNSGGITKTFLEFGNYPGGASYAATFPETQYISHGTFNI
jgi:hypothetical protein